MVSDQWVVGSEVKGAWTLDAPSGFIVKCVDMTLFTFVKCVGLTPFYLTPFYRFIAYLKIGARRVIASDSEAISR
ncbi:MAG: hypothetical protein KAV83_06325 [Desulfobacterales bacterium]|nr:hypothetical protein [Desulfobacterales bacterium]